MQTDHGPAFPHDPDRIGDGCGNAGVSWARYGGIIRGLGRKAEYAKNGAERSRSVSEKSFPQSASPTLRYILPSFGCRSPLRRPHSDKISHKLRRAAHEKPFSDTL